MFRNHFGGADNGSKIRMNSLYHPSYTNGEELNPNFLGFIKEEDSSFEDNEESRNDKSCAAGNYDDYDNGSIDDLDSQKDDDESECYTYDEFVRDFESILPKEKKNEHPGREKIDEIILTDMAETYSDSANTDLNKQHSMDEIIETDGSNEDPPDDAYASSSELEPKDSTLVSPQQRQKDKLSHDMLPIRLQMQQDAIVTVAQRRESRAAALRRCPLPPKSPTTGATATTDVAKPPRPSPRHNKLLSTMSTRSITSSNNSRQKHASHHPHHVPVKEPSKSRLEEKLRGVSTKAAMKSNNSVGTSELGSIMTKDSDLPIPSMIFHRTHPKSPENDDFSDSARSSPSSMHNTYMNTSLAAASTTNNSSPHTYSVDGCRAITSEIASQVSILLPGECDEEYGTARENNSPIMKCPTSDEVVMQCQPIQTHPLPPKPHSRVTKSVTNGNCNHLVDDFESSGNAGVAKFDNHQLERQDSADIAIAMIDSELGRAKSKLLSFSSGDNAIDRKMPLTPTPIVRSSPQAAAGSNGYLSAAGQKENQYIRSNASSAASGKSTTKDWQGAKTKDWNRVLKAQAGSEIRVQGKATSRRMEKNIASNSSRLSALHRAVALPQRGGSGSMDTQKVKNFWTQLDEKNQSRSASSSPESKEQPQTSNIVNNSVSNNNTERWQHQHQRQIPTSFNKKSINVQKGKGVVDDVSGFSSHHSSIFEAFEVAPLLTTISSDGNNGKKAASDSQVLLKDFGVHHSFVKRGAYKKRVGFPETAKMQQQRQNTMPPLLEIGIESNPSPSRPPPPPPTTLSKTSSVALGGFPAGDREVSSQNEEFEVMLQSRNLQSHNLQRGGRSKAHASKRPQVRSSSGKSQQQEQQVGVGSSSKRNPQNGKIKERLRSRWNRMVKGGSPENMTSSTVMNRDNNGGEGVLTRGTTSSRKLSSSTSSKSKSHQHQPPLPSSSAVGSKTAARRSISNNKNNSLASRKRNSGSWVARKDADGKVHFTQR